MATVLAIVGIVSTICSCVVSCFYAYINYKRSMKQKDEYWEAALQITLRSDGNAETMKDIYEQLRFWKEHPDEVRRHLTIANAMNAAEQDTE